MRTGKIRASVARWVLSGLVLGAVDRAVAAAPASAAPPIPALLRYRQATEELWARLDFSGLDPRALQEELGASPEDLARGMAERIRFESYPGVLRGARGTLLAGAGNSWDRA